MYLGIEYWAIHNLASLSDSGPSWYQVILSWGEIGDLNLNVIQKLYRIERERERERGGGGRKRQRQRGRGRERERER